MEPVKITGGKEWSSIDIFLFSNGQQYSPPRKYHLCSEELQWWDMTVSYLGRTLYGSGHSSIKLYTIDGTIVNGPLELINGAAYVAVEPPDSFIDTGYEEYLLKASRSWEKRLAQKFHNNETSKSDLKYNENDPVVRSNTDEVTIPGNIIDTATLQNDSNTISSPQKCRPTKPCQRLQKKSIAGSKQIQKKKSFDTHGTILKRICAETDKIFPCPKKSFPKKTGSINRKPLPIGQRKLNEPNPQELSLCYKKRDSTRPEMDLKTETTKNLNAFETAPVREHQIIDLYNNEESDLISLIKELDNYAVINKSINLQRQNNLIPKKIPVQEAYRDKTKTDNNEDIEKHSSNKLKQIHEYELTNILPVNDSLQNETENNQEHKPIMNNNNEKEADNTVLNHKSEKQIIDEYVAHMNKGGLLLLKVKVKLKDCKTIFNRNKSENIPTATSVSNIPKTEKTSQVDINISFSGEFLKPNDQQCIRDKSLQSILDKLYTKETDYVNSKNPTVILLQCACRDYLDNHESCMCDTNQGGEIGGTKCEATLYKKINETFTSCECYNSILRTSKDEHALQNGLLNQATKDTNDGRPSFSKVNGTRVKYLAQKFETSDKTMGKEEKENSNYNRNSYDVSLNGNQRKATVLTRIYGNPALEIDTENQNREESIDPNSKKFYNKSTQTDWSNVLLEAKLHEDKRYTFHFPPLHILKQCNLWKLSSIS